MTDKTGWIVRSVAWGNVAVDGQQRHFGLIESDDVYLVLGPVPAKTTPHSWTLLNMRTGARKTVLEKEFSVLRYKRLA